MTNTLEPGEPIPWLCGATVASFKKGCKQMEKIKLTVSGDYGDFQTVNEFWDCECETGFIKNKATQPTCKKCEAWHEESPDSRLNEVLTNLNEGGE